MRRVGIVMPVRHWYFHAILQGIVDYSTSHRSWLLYINELGDITIDDLVAGDRIDGVIWSAGFDHPSLSRFQALVNARVPIVSTTSGDPIGSSPRVDNDDFAVGRIAAEAFLERGYTQFAFCGIAADYSRARQQGYESRLNQSGMKCIPYTGPTESWGHFSEYWENSPLARWLVDLPKPTALFTDNDLRARQVLYACRLAGVHVPEELAVIGVDNEAPVCECTDPPLSSIPLDLRRLGYEAATLLDRLIDGDAPPADPIRVPPLPLVRRRSSDFLAINDPDVAQAVRFIWDNSARNIAVKHILANVPVSRRALETGFKKHIGRSPKAELRRVRIEHAKMMLARGRQSMEDIARACGFSTALHLDVVFKRQTGMTPTTYRKTHSIH